MKRALHRMASALACIVSTACVGAARPDVAAPPPAAMPQAESIAPSTDRPARRTIGRIEAGLGFWGDAAEVGLPGVVAANGRSWRVRVRDDICRPDGAGVICTYQARPCHHPPPETEPKSWCPRERRFVRGHNFAGADGWIAEVSDTEP